MDLDTNNLQQSKKRKFSDNEDGNSDVNSPGSSIIGGGQNHNSKSEWDDEQLSNEIKSETSSQTSTNSSTQTTTTAKPAAKRSRWDTPMAEPTVAATPMNPSIAAGSATPLSSVPGSSVSSTPKRNRWDATPERSSWDETEPSTKTAGDGILETPSRKAKSRWDETPIGVAASFGPGATPSASILYGAMTPSPEEIQRQQAQLAQTNPELLQNMRWEREIDERNRPLSDEELDAIFPSEGYKILEPPTSYVPIRTPSRKVSATPVSSGFAIQDEAPPIPPSHMNLEPGGDLPSIKPEDRPYFEKLLEEEDITSMTAEEAKERKIMKLLLKIKNGTPPMRKVSLRQITEKARDFGPSALFNQILPLLMSPALEDQERHLLVKVIDRILYKLDDLVRPFVHKILVVIEPLLIDEDYYARVEGREIIANLAKAAGLSTMIATMRPDIDNPDEYVRNTTGKKKKKTL